MHNMITIERHFLDQKGNIPAELTDILYDINLAAKVIRRAVQSADLTDSTGAAGTTNVHGEEVKKLDVLANECIKQLIGAHGRFCVMASEEEETLVVPSRDDGDYVLLFDPLDGSSNLDVNVSVGTIFSIFKLKDRTKNPSIRECLQKGSEQVAAGYVIYGSSVVMVYTAGHGVHGFTYDPSIGEFLCTHEFIRIPDKAQYYSVNEGLTQELNDGTKAFLDYLKSNQNELGKPYSARYVGSLVADFHRNLLKGGIFMYPATKKSPKGKLRLMYEANPLAFICEQAGGKASDGDNRILDIPPTELHQRTPLYIGNAALVDKAAAFEKKRAEQLVF